MKIIYIANARIPTEKAHGYQITKMCESLAQNGAAVELVVPYRANPQLKGVSAFDYYHLQENFKIKKINSWDPVFLMARGNGFYYKIQTFFFTVGLFFYFIFSLPSSGGVAKRRAGMSGAQRANANADESELAQDSALPRTSWGGVLKNHFIYTRDELLLPLLTLFSKKVVWEAHDLPKNRKIKSWQKCFKIIAITNGLRQEIIKSGMAPEKIMTAPDGVDLKLFESVNQSKENLRPELSLPPDKKIILYAGHLYEWKGADILAQTADKIGENVVLIFLGGTGQDLIDFKNKYGHQKNILLINWVSNQFVPKYMKAADILVLPNSAKFEISRTYTSPLKLFEYLAAGRPIIASDLPSLREILSEKEAVFFQPDNAEDLAAKINWVLENYGQGEILAKNARRKVEDYTWEKRAASICQFCCLSLIRNQGDV